MRGEFTTVAVPSEYEENIKGSRFIGCIRNCGSAEDLDRILDEIRYYFPNATHYCYAALFDGCERFSDNGEPSGTAGRPMIAVLRGSGLDDVAVVAVRYFGGTLLGTGGLVQAYTGVTAGVVRSAQRTKMFLCRTIRFKLRYQEYDRFVSECSRMVVGKPVSVFEDAVEMTVNVRIDDVEAFTKAVTDIAKGDIHFEELGEGFSADVRNTVK